jgi:hypothetical protein
VLSGDHFSLVRMHANRLDTASDCVAAAPNANDLSISCFALGHKAIRLNFRVPIGRHTSFRRGDEQVALTPAQSARIAKILAMHNRMHDVGVVMGAGAGAIDAASLGRAVVRNRMPEMRR